MNFIRNWYYLLLGYKLSDGSRTIHFSYRKMKIVHIRGFGLIDLNNDSWWVVRRFI
jgi:hypothetical protein